jgi:endonuclease-3
MKEKEINIVMAALGRQVKSLHVPWVGTLASTSRDPFKILISCILSLRTQDKTTEEASGRLFNLASTPAEMSALSEKSIEKAIYPVGFYRVKAKTIKALSRELVHKHQSVVPSTMQELLSLKGVGRKTANLVLTLGYNLYGICVDTHVHRITNRWGYVQTTTPEETEYALREKLPRKYWKEINGLLVAFGQHICKPISPFCSKCDLNNYCAKVGVLKSR